jgi:hypothetical protein
MSKRLAVILACGVLVSLFSSNVRALTVSFAWAQTRTPHITLVRDRHARALRIVVSSPEGQASRSARVSGCTRHLCQCL